MTLAIFCPSTGDHQEAMLTWVNNATILPMDVTIDQQTEGDEAGFLSKCQRFYGNNQSDIHGYIHSDLLIHESGWDQRVLTEFDDPTVGVVGFVGAKRLGYEDIYKIPYSHTQLARYDVISNLTDAEVHGLRSTANHDVAVLDSCAVFVRRSLLSRAGGWPVDTYPNNAHCSDLWICLMAARLGYRIRIAGVGCTHRSGGKGEVGSKWLEQHGTDIAHHRRAHELIYDQFRDILPLRIL